MNLSMNLYILLFGNVIVGDINAKSDIFGTVTDGIGLEAGELRFNIIFAFGFNDILFIL